MREHSIKFYLGSRWDWLLFSASGAQHDGADSVVQRNILVVNFFKENLSLGSSTSLLRETMRGLAADAGTALDVLSQR